jgi:hypothetical protein
MLCFSSYSGVYRHLKPEVLKDVDITVIDYLNPHSQAVDEELGIGTSTRLLLRI